MSGAAGLPAAAAVVVVVVMKPVIASAARKSSKSLLFQFAVRSKAQIYTSSRCSGKLRVKRDFLLAAV